MPPESLFNSSFFTGRRKRDNEFGSTTGSSNLNDTNASQAAGGASSLLQRIQGQQIQAQLLGTLTIRSRDATLGSTTEKRQVMLASRSGGDAGSPTSQRRVVAPISWVLAATGKGHFTPRFESREGPRQHTQATETIGSGAKSQQPCPTQQRTMLQPPDAPVTPPTLQSKVLSTQRKRVSVSMSPPTAIPLAGSLEVEKDAIAAPSSSNPNANVFGLSNLVINTSICLEPANDLLVAPTPKHFVVPDWSAADPFTPQEKSVLAEITRFRADTRQYAQQLLNKLVFALSAIPSRTLDELANDISNAVQRLQAYSGNGTLFNGSFGHQKNTGGGGKGVELLAPESVIHRCSLQMATNTVPRRVTYSDAIAYITKVNDIIEGTSPSSPTGATGASLGVSECFDEVPRGAKHTTSSLLHQKSSLKQPSSVANIPKAGPGGGKGNAAKEDVAAREAAEDAQWLTQVREALSRHIDECSCLVREKSVFLDKLLSGYEGFGAINSAGRSSSPGTSGTSLPRVNYNRGLCLAARELARQLADKPRKNCLPLQDMLAQYGKLTGETSEFVVMGAKEPQDVVSEVVLQALREQTDRVLLYPTTLFGGVGWQRHPTEGAVAVIVLTTGFQEISYIRKHRNLPIVELRRCMALGQMSSDERLYDLNFIPQHYGVRAINPTAHPVVCGAHVELLLECPPMITLSCNLEGAAEATSPPGATESVTFVDRVGRTAHVHILLVQCTASKLAVFARHPQELSYKRASTVLLRPIASRFNSDINATGHVTSYPIQNELFQHFLGELISPREGRLTSGATYHFVVRMSAAMAHRCTLNSANGSWPMQRFLKSRTKMISRALLSPSNRAQQQPTMGPSPVAHTQSTTPPHVKSAMDENATPRSNSTDGHVTSVRFAVKSEPPSSFAKQPKRSMSLSMESEAPTPMSNSTVATFSLILRVRTGTLVLLVDDQHVLTWEVVSPLDETGAAGAS